MQVEKGRLISGRFRVPYRAYGGGSETLVCVNGAQQSMAVWRSFVAYFHEEYRVVIFDLPGQGRSTRLSGSPVATLDEQVAALDDIVVATRQGGTVSIAGASWGTIVTTVYAARFPDAVHKIILGGFGMRATDVMNKLISEGRALYAENRKEDVGRLIVEHLGKQVSTAQQHKIIEQFRSLAPDKCQTFSAQCDFVVGTGDIRRLAELDRISAKTLIINGKDDELLDPEDARAAARQIPNCELCFVPNVGHFLHFESKDVMGMYRDFLDE